MWRVMAAVMTDSSQEKDATAQGGGRNKIKTWM